MFTLAQTRKPDVSLNVGFTGGLFREIRRKDRVWDDGRAWELLARGEYGFLSLCGTNGYGYGIPISYALSGKSVYFHCAPEGYKLECVRANNRACFCVVGHTRIIPEGFTTEYRSVMAFGTVACSLPETERLSAHDLLVDKYSADFKDIAAKYIAGSFHRTEILRLDIEHLSGKHKELHK